MIKKEFIKLQVSELIPYDNNPRINDEAVHDTVQSMKDCGVLDPIEIDENNVILSGHTRLLALQELGETEADVIRYTGLNEEQKKKYRILANKTNEMALWDTDKLEKELEGLDFSEYDFEFEKDIPFDESLLDDLFTDAPEKEKEPKKIQCPCCGEWFEI